MRGVKFITNEKKGKLLQVDIKAVSKNPQRFEDLMDVLIAEERGEEKEYTLEEVKSKLKRAGKI